MIATEIFIDPTDKQSPVKETWVQLVKDMMPVVAKGGNTQELVNKWLRSKIRQILNKYKDAFSEFNIEGTISVNDFDTQHASQRLTKFLEETFERSVDDLMHAVNLATGNVFSGKKYTTIVDGKKITKKFKDYTIQQLKTLLITRDEFVKMNDGT